MIRTRYVRRSLILSATVLLLFSGRIRALQEISPDRELKEIDLNGWNCVSKPEGNARSPESNDRNRLKGRMPVDLGGVQVQAFDTAGFLRHVSALDPELANKRRKDLTPDQKKHLEPLEKQIVSLTGYLMLAYPGPPESTNCGSVDFHDWHLEVCEKPSDHPPQPGDPTPIICEITPRTQNNIFRAGIRIQQLTGFFRTTDLSYESTGHKAQKIRVTGYLLWDDEHNAEKDVGTTIKTIGRSKYHNPWRSTAWEIHPIIKIEKLDGLMPQMDSLPAAPPVTGSPPPSEAPTPAETETVPSSPPPATATPVSTPTPIPTATPQKYVTILRQVKIKIPYGETVLQRGMRFPIISRGTRTVTVEYLGRKQVIPIDSTDLREIPKSDPLKQASPQPSP